MFIKNKYKIHDKEGYATIYYINKKKQSFEILVDLEDLKRMIDLNLAWRTTYKPEIDSHYTQATQYIGKIDGEYKYRIIELHRFVMNAKKGEYVDHINHNTLDNRKSNLRITTNKQNTRNRSGLNTNNTSGYRNVSWSKDYKQWLVQMQVDGTNKVLGKFDDVHKAGEFAKQMRKKYYGDFRGKGTLES